MINKIYISKIRDPYFNVAMEYSLLKGNLEGVGLFLWRNYPSVFIGRNQNLYAECNLDLLDKYKVAAVRRFSGGGAVYQDLGNLNFSYICSSKNYNLELLKDITKNALQNLGVSCEFNGRNDLVVGEKKISGQAFYQEDDNYLYHGTMLIDVDMDILSKVLNPSKLKLESKGISSVKSRVMNLKQKFNNITVEDVENSFIESFKNEFESEIINLDDYSLADNLLYEKLKSKTWLYGQSPKWNIRLEEKIPQGNLEILVDVEDGKISCINIYTDSLYNIDFTQAKKSLEGMWFDRKATIDVIKANMVFL